MQVCTAHGSVDAYLGMFQDVACYRDSPSFSAAGANDVWTIKDLSTHDRVVVGVKNPLETRK